MEPHYNQQLGQHNHPWSQLQGDSHIFFALDLGLFDGVGSSKANYEKPKCFLQRATRQFWMGSINNINGFLDCPCFKQCALSINAATSNF